MKGKLLIDKIMRPSVVFATGVFIIMLLVSYFVHLHIEAAGKVEDLSLALEEINDGIVNLLADETFDRTAGEDLSRLAAGLYDKPVMKTFFTLYPEIRPSSITSPYDSKGEVMSLYSDISRIKERIKEHIMNREQSLRILYFLILVIIVAMFLLLGVSQFENYKLIRSEKLRNETNSKLYDQLEKERSLIAFELHDDIAQKLAVIKRYFSSKNSIDEHTNLMEHYATDVIRRVRYLSRMLKAPDNPDVSFKDYLETLFSDFNVLSDFKLNRKTVGLNALKLSPTAALHIYRIIQEVLTNSRIHSEATEIDLHLVYSHPTLTIKYKDNGKGFDPYLVYRKGIGLDSIKYRLDLLKGEYRLNSKEGEGTDISIDIPVELCETSL